MPVNVACGAMRGDLGEAMHRYFAADSATFHAWNTSVRAPREKLLNGMDRNTRILFSTSVAKQSRPARHAWRET
jgi:hypothetical protein